MKNIFISILVLLILGVAGYVFIGSEDRGSFDDVSFTDNGEPKTVTDKVVSEPPVQISKPTIVSGVEPKGKTAPDQDDSVEGSIPDGWEKYVDSTYNFSFLYPEDVTLSKSQNSVTILIDDVHNPSIQVWENTDGVTFDSELQKCKDDPFTGAYEIIQIGGEQAFWCQGEALGPIAKVVTDEVIYLFLNHLKWENNGILETFEF